ncbi:MAG: hypothetical protein JWQ72_846 [Polaromonas sp.]|nr:hypothetical protein [Polaromonas sp.]
MRRLSLNWVAGLALGTVLPVTSMAQTPAPLDGRQAEARRAFDQPVAAGTLDSYRGGSEVVRNDMQLTGNTSGNVAMNVAAGSNAINAGSFANMTGLPVVIQNSGANVLIQSALILNLQIN